MKRSIAKLCVPGTSIFQESSPPWPLPRRHAGQELLGAGRGGGLWAATCFEEMLLLFYGQMWNRIRKLISRDELCIRSWIPDFNPPSKGVICLGCLRLHVSEAESFPIRVCPPGSLKTDLSVYIIILKGRSIAIQKKTPGDGGGNGRGDFNTTHVFSLYSLQEVWLPTHYLECYPRNNAGIVRWIFLPLLYESVIKQRMTGIRW